MKVCTDACLFGAWVANKLANTNINSVLDIGAGTGLLTLILAQKINAHFTSVEIDALAFEQASQNFAQSKWHNNITIEHDDILKFSSTEKFDLIISNPPFYEKDLKSDKHSVNLARHDVSLTLPALLKTCNNLLSHSGQIALLLPFHRLSDLQKETLANNLFIGHLLLVKQTPTHNYFRMGAILQKQQTETSEEIIVIKNSPNNYSNEFASLLKDYYLR